MLVLAASVTLALQTKMVTIDQLQATLAKCQRFKLDNPDVELPDEMWEELSDMRLQRAAWYGRPEHELKTMIDNFLEANG
jgi:hypothetical protein